MAKQVRVRDADKAIAARLDFKAGAMTGRYVTRGESIALGVLPAEEREQIRDAVFGVHPVYVVWSYQTPIAWVIERGAEHEAVVPNLRYSVTTTTHQHECRMALDAPRDYPAERRAVGVSHFGSREGW